MEQLSADVVPSRFQIHRSRLMGDPALSRFRLIAGVLRQSLYQIIICPVRAGHIRHHTDIIGDIQSETIRTPVKSSVEHHHGFRSRRVIKRPERVVRVSCNPAVFRSF